MAQTNPDRRPGLSTLRRANIELVLDALRLKGPSSQAGLARETGLSPATITSIVRTLVSSGRVETRALNKRETVVTLAPQTGRYVSVSVRPKTMHGVLVDFTAERYWEASVLTPEHDGEGPGAYVRLVGELLALAGLERSDLSGAAVGMQCPISRASGEVASWAGTRLPGWKSIPVAAHLEELLGVPVIVDNDANLGGLAEWSWGAGQGDGVLFYVLSSSHVGGAIVLDGEVLRGADGLAGEIGHMVVDSSGPMCECGSRGCLAVYASERAIIGALRSEGSFASLPDVIGAAREGDLRARGVLFDVGRQMGRALADVGKLLAPNTIVLGGELGRAGSLLLAGLRASIEVTSLRAVSPSIQFRPAQLVAGEVELGGIAALLRSEGADVSELPAWLRM
ncbi:ROK family transcriptional regulator [Brachybacterium kimchii]|uniref:ROK family transcriptional regulator n=1 Tax=Brachybacterium kimchii TaxID=2942909 RepID=A0ABY4NAP1_9MICO|nr:ROK family transcriptional regulator [Brachybacterium kimchii]UQN30439.1 ROK family transcriptional regulator [Brachybacterium kimchii]